MVLRSILLLLFLLQFNYSGSSSNNDSIVNPIFSAIYNQEFDRAESLLVSQKDKLEPFYSDVLSIDLLWWKFSTTRSKEDARNVNNLLKKQVQLGIEKNDKVAQLIGKSYQLRYARKKYNLFDVISLRSEINTLLSALDRKKLPIAGNELKLFDLYMVMFNYFSRVNPFSIWSKSLERDFYLTEMEQFAEEDNLIVKTMAHYFLGRIYQKVEREPLKASEHFLTLTKQFPENKLFVEHLKDCEEKR